MFKIKSLIARLPPKNATAETSALFVHMTWLQEFRLTNIHVLMVPWFDRQAIEPFIIRCRLPISTCCVRACKYFSPFSPPKNQVIATRERDLFLDLRGDLFL